MTSPIALPNRACLYSTAPTPLPHHPPTGHTHIHARTRSPAHSPGALSFTVVPSIILSILSAAWAIFGLMLTSTADFIEPVALSALSWTESGTVTVGGCACDMAGLIWICYPLSEAWINGAGIGNHTSHGSRVCVCGREGVECECGLRGRGDQCTGEGAQRAKLD